MTIGNYIQAKLNRFHLAMSTEELEVVLLGKGLNFETDYNKDQEVNVKSVLVAVIPELLLAPDWSQGGTSIKRNTAGVMAYYSLLCGELGLPDALNPSSYDVNDRSDVW